jgi:hypothetical protein
MNHIVTFYKRQSLADQECIGWQLAMRGYLSKYWGLAVAANRHLKENNDKGIVWVRKTILQIWEFSHEMWEHRNAVLHDMQFESSQTVQNAEINDGITKLYVQVDAYVAKDPWYFDAPLTLRPTKAFTIETSMAHKRKNLGKQV